MIVATGRETGGDGDVSATVKLVLLTDSEGTRLDVDTDLAITGKVAQLEGDKLGDAWSSRLAQLVVELDATPCVPRWWISRSRTRTRRPTHRPRSKRPKTGDRTRSWPRRSRRRRSRPRRPPATAPRCGGPSRTRPFAVELLDVEATPVLRRLAPVAGLVVTVLVVRWLVRRRRSA